MRCPRCHATNWMTAKFCAACGQELAEWGCRNCGQANRAAASFCTNCGAPRSVGAKPPQSGTVAGESELRESELRQLTLLLCDVVGSTSVSDSLHPEDFHLIMLEFHEVVRDIVRASGGVIAQAIGDGALAYFGYPRAHEDDAARAIRSGLRIVAAVKQHRLAASAGAPGLAVRVACHTGTVIVDPVQNDAAAAVPHADGLAFSIAARLERMARPNSVCVSESTYALTKDFFEFRDAGEHHLRGVSHSVRVYEVVDERCVRSRFEATSRADLAPLVDRQGEFVLLKEKWRATTPESGYCVLISGKPGIGKSRLVSAFRDFVEEEGGSWLGCQCSDYTRNSAFAPLVELVRGLLAEAGADLSALTGESLRTALGEYGVLAESEVAAMRSLLLPGEPPARNVGTPHELKRALFAGLRRILLHARPLPLVLALEDIHWADASSLEFLALLQNEGPTPGLFLILTFRSGDFSASWPAHISYSQLALAELPEEDARALATLTDRTNRLSPEALAHIVETAGGVPLFVEECTKATLEAENDRRTGRAAARAPGAGGEVPGTLLDILTARLDGLGGAKAVAQLGATVGRSFSHRVIAESYQRLIGGDTAREAALDEDLQRLERSEIVFRRGVSPDSEYLFKHALVRETAYASLPPRRRKHYHHIIAEVMESQQSGAAGARPELLAYHFSHAGLPLRALPYWLEAGERSAHNSANVEAIDHLRNAVEDARKLEADEDRIYWEVKCRLSLGVPLLALGGWASPDVAENYRAARDLTLDSPEDPETPCQIVRYLFNYHLLRVEVPQARDYLTSLYRLAEPLGEPNLMASAYNCEAAFAMFVEGDVPKATRLFERSFATFTRERGRQYVFHSGADPEVTILSLSSLACLASGNRVDAAERSRRALEVGRRIDHPFSQSYALCVGATVAQLLEGPEASLEIASEAARLAERYGQSYWVAYARLIEAWSRARLEPDRGDPVALQQARRGYASTGARLLLPYAACLLADLHLVRREPDRMLACLEEAAPLELAFFRPWMLRLEGEALWLRNGAGERARARFEEAAELACRQGAFFFAEAAAERLSGTARSPEEEQQAASWLERSRLGMAGTS